MSELELFRNAHARQVDVVGWGVDVEVLRSRGVVIERIIARAPGLLDASVGQTPAQALTFMTLDPRMVESYFEYVHIVVDTPERL